MRQKPKTIKRLCFGNGANTKASVISYGPLTGTIEEYGVEFIIIVNYNL